MLETICPACGNEKKVIPAGVSRKTNKPYQAFSVCETCNPSKKPAPAPQDNETLNRVLKGVEAIYKKVEAMEAFLLTDEAQTKFEKELEEPEEEDEREEEIDPKLDVPF